MKVKIGKGVRKRTDEFGGICYVPSRDDFFAANREVYALIETLSDKWKTVPREEVEAFRVLAGLGVCQTMNPETPQRAYSGPSFLGTFPEIPTVSEPLVVNCFCTSHCPLRCVYCHADDLMIGFRESEEDDDLDNVISTANMIPSMVAVITGGDPLTRPRRAERLIRRLAGGKSLVLDTSGVGEIGVLLDVLVEYDVHVRISLDSISEANDRLRPINRKYVAAGTLSRHLAEETITRCLSAGLNVTVQTVVSSKNESLGELLDLRDWLVSRGVRNWVLHVAVKGGSARRLEKEAMKKSRQRGILPSEKVYSILWRIVEDTMLRELPVDIRCTDTDTSPNSVLLVGSKGDLYTEGYAHDGKVVLYSAGQARPDLLAALWPHIDRFGHARRYLNWNPWFFDGRSLDEICVKVPVPPKEVPRSGMKQVVETEAKFWVTDPSSLNSALSLHGFIASERLEQRDEYFDFKDRRLHSLDFAVRLRKESGRIFVSLKGPRFYASNGEYSRIELEFEAKNEAAIREDMRLRQLEITWYFEKRRMSYSRPESPVVVEIDEVPEIGVFAEIEGPLEDVRAVLLDLGPYLGPKERRNYKEIFVEFKKIHGADTTDIKGARFGGS